ncbi:putative ABC transporter, permease/ATP-binding protein [Myxococcus xanthus DK 1622]|uniref:ABC transporter, permease/ATP-binding protein n=1 Tax=Myxococcus xanthus (strain DK1622) TaxID=246197 RepID=Q1D395_MYXXD|nr:MULTISPECIES: ABC transporter ATP-binding protein [Myxococcus]ABF86896.1 putative ABC transporter, permease/ATP-binding protein [Myxococcus xanthus DK 1622]NOJ52458.1 ABC transporter ATP-binding protein [Myxococcus xanthus]QPM77266.1 ABC transporter ATP-binding protein [Myxococcus xanthus]QVW66335.1 ABC transporter ATP-binding protein [Myxococcus xanthus DZ2]QZZ52390.1 putative ABC transporter ATP-binding protein [Myxococcus xanthus]
MHSILWRLLRYARPHFGVLLLAFVGMAAVGLTTGAYAYLTGPALRFLLSGGEEGFASAQRVPWLADLPREAALWGFPLVMVIVGAAKGVGYLAQFYFMGLFAQRVVKDLRRDLFQRLTALSPAQLARERMGDLLSRFSSDVSAVEAAAMYTVGSYLRDTLQVIILAGVALAMSPMLGGLMLLVIPLAALPASKLTRKVLKRTREGQTQLGNLAGQLHEGLGGLRTIQAFNGQAAELARFSAFAQAHEKAVVSAAWARGAVPGLMEVLAAAALAGALAYAASARLMEPEALLSLLTAVILVYQPVKDLGRVTQFAVQAGAAGERLFSLLDMKHPVEDAPDAVPAPTLSRSIQFEGVRFAYGERPALDGLTLELKAGQVTALVGGSGGGKSTVTSLLLRFERPQKGQLLLDGVDADRYTATSVRAQFALVTQEPLLFHGTVLDNLRYARPDATREEVEAAAKVAHADGFIRALPEGYDTRIGERGVALSGGQRQRLCIARAVLAQAPVLVLDEATSSLDPESEREVQAALAAVLPGRTALVIAHRLSTVVNADVLNVMEAGRVVESGSHAELLQRGGRYAALWRMQTEGSSERGAA